MAQSLKGKSSVYREAYKRKTNSGERSQLRIKNIISYHIHGNNKKNFLKKIKNKTKLKLSSRCYDMIRENTS